MALPLEKLGTTYDETTEVIDPDRAKAYAAATNDPNPAYAEGRFAPPVFGVVPTWGAMGLAVADVVPAEALMMIVHGEQDMHFHQPLVPGAKLRTKASAHSVRVAGSGTRFTIQVDSVDDSGDPVLTEYVTMFIRGMSDGESGGPDKPNHDLPDLAAAKKVGSHTVHVDDDQTYRYKEASGDNMPIHVDDAFAKQVGLPGIIAHGLCTMAMCSQSVIELAAGGDPGRLKRLAVRFAANVFPGNDVETTVYALPPDEGGNEVYVFEATSAGQTVIKNGRAEIAPA
ncbi:MAG TPA: MaoC/PaaZ C-terminal domain-containing protein [Acidimicrobiales bacterium]|nr:MaoC/PaaZ C-terminal domain-containing protein [Acidimicrobiales bacterium]